MNFKKIIMVLGTVAAISIPVGAVVACGSGETTPPNPHKFHPGQNAEDNKIIEGTWKGKNDIPMYKQATDMDWSSLNYLEAKVVKWIDGDTPIVDVVGGTGADTTQKNLHIRVAGIDTPELHVTNEATGKIDQLTTGTEFKYADAARIWANKRMPVGSIIRIPTNGAVSYNRIVGHIFYGKNFEHNFEVEILKAGLALPFINDAVEAVDTKAWQHYAYREMADAYNFAKDNKLGIFEVGAEQVSKVHGSTSVMNVTRYATDKGNEDHRTIYAITKDLD